MNITEMRTLLRRDLRDTDPAGYRWADEELDRHLLRAARELSGYLPLAQTAELTTSAGSREVDIASLTDRVCIEAVEYPAGLSPASLPGFQVRGDTLLLMDGEVPDGSICRVYWGKLHALDTSGSTIPSRLSDLVIAGAAGYAAAAQGAGAINCGGFIILFRDGLQTCQQDDHNIAHAFPGVNSNHRKQRDFGVNQPFQRQEI